MYINYGEVNYERRDDKSFKYSNRFSFENLNFRPHNVPRIMKIIKEHHPELLSKYKQIQKDRTYWDILEHEIKAYCGNLNLNYAVEFHHGGFSKS